MVDARILDSSVYEEFGRRLMGVRTKSEIEQLVFDAMVASGYIDVFASISDIAEKYNVSSTKAKNLVMQCQLRSAQTENEKLSNGERVVKVPFQQSSASNNETIVCLINFGKISSFREDFDGFMGVDDLTDYRSIFVFFDGDGDAIGYALPVNDNQYVIDNCSPGDVDSDLLRRNLPQFISDVWNLVLLASIDIEEIIDEGVEHQIFLPDQEAPESTQPFFIGTDAAWIKKQHEWIFVQKVFGIFEFEKEISAVFPIKKFLKGDMPGPVTLTLEALGDITDYDTVTETLCAIRAHKH